MRYKKYIILLILFIGIMAIVLLPDFSNSNYEFYDKIDLSEEEQKKLEDFYADGKISKGRVFDLKFDYFKSTDDYSIIIVKKINNKLSDLNITFIGKNGNGETELLTKFPLNDTYQNFQNETTHPHIWRDGSNGMIMGDIENKNKITNKLVIYINWKNGKEKHYIEAPV